MISKATQFDDCVLVDCVTELSAACGEGVGVWGDCLDGEEVGVVEGDEQDLETDELRTLAASWAR